MTTSNDTTTLRETLRRAAFALSIFPKCDHVLVRGEGTACGALAHFRLGNAWYCAEHRDQGRVSAYPIDGKVQFGNERSMNFDDLCVTLGMPKPDSAMARLARGAR